MCAGGTRVCGGGPDRETDLTVCQSDFLMARPVRRSVLGGSALLCASWLLSGCRSALYGDALYRLQLATAGKDVMWMPSSQAISMAMLKAANTQASDVVYDLGSGDGVIPILAAKHFGSRAVGIEYNPDLVELSRRNALRAGVADRTSFMKADLFEVDFSKASVVTLYLGEAINLKLVPRLEGLKPGTRIVSNRFDLGSWRADRIINEVPDELAMLWIVPARLQGRWRTASRIGLGFEAVEIIQSHQMIELRTVGSGLAARVGEGRISGMDVSIEIQHGQSAPLSLRGSLSSDGQRLSLTATADARLTNPQAIELIRF